LCNYPDHQQLLPHKRQLIVSCSAFYAYDPMTI
jgi:hypothetical protein